MMNAITDMFSFGDTPIWVWLLRVAVFVAVAWLFAVTYHKRKLRYLSFTRLQHYAALWDAPHMRTARAATCRRALSGRDEVRKGRTLSGKEERVAGFFNALGREAAHGGIVLADLKKYFGAPTGLYLALLGSRAGAFAGFAEVLPQLMEIRPDEMDAAEAARAELEAISPGQPA